MTLIDGPSSVQLIREKVKPRIADYFMRTPHTCVICRSQRATQLNCNLAPYPATASEGPAIFACNPYPICESSMCNAESLRRAHEDRREVAREAPDWLGAVENEMCDYCNKIQNVQQHGRLKRCSRCKAKYYCSRDCQMVRRQVILRKFTLHPACSSLVSAYLIILVPLLPPPGNISTGSLERHRLMRRR